MTRTQNHAAPAPGRLPQILNEPRFGLPTAAAWLAEANRLKAIASLVEDQFIDKSGKSEMTPSTWNWTWALIENLRDRLVLLEESVDAADRDGDLDVVLHQARALAETLLRSCGDDGSSLSNEVMGQLSAELAERLNGCVVEAQTEGQS